MLASESRCALSILIRGKMVGLELGLPVGGRECRVERLSPRGFEPARVCLVERALIDVKGESVRGTAISICFTHDIGIVYCRYVSVLIGILLLLLCRAWNNRGLSILGESSGRGSCCGMLHVAPF